MLTNLSIENVALIEKTEIEFQTGLNILSGETGAGKSMIIDSLHFCLGERVSRDFLRKGEKQAQVAALFIVENTELLDKLSERGVTVLEDGALLLSRSINDTGKTVCRVNGSIVTIGMLKELTEGLIDIHGQHAHQSLLNPARHILLLDRFCQTELSAVMQEYENSYDRYLKIDKEWKALLDADDNRESEKDFLQFQADEIAEAKLSVKEEEELNKRRQALVNKEKLQRISEEAMELLYEGKEDMPAAADMIAKATECVRSLEQIDGQVEGVYEALESIAAQLDDAIRELRRYGDGLESDDHSLLQIEERLQEFYRLKQKYGGSIPKVLSHYEAVIKKLDGMEHREERLAELANAQKQALALAMSFALKISNIRKNKGLAIAKAIETHLHDLEMKHARFEISLTQKEVLTPSGIDNVEFLISPNQGEDLKPLAKIASGGEMSRVMLALKTILADADTIDTFIFDEIDQGVSGRTAQKVAEKMSVMGKTHQIISITHLPQIAAMADAHFVIEKSTKGQKTVTQVTALEDEAAVLELARLIGGNKITDATVLAARELKSQGCQLKQ